MKKTLSAILVILLFSLSACSLLGKAPKDTIPKDYISAGTYKAGVDIPTGEYLLIGDGYLEVALSKGASVLSGDFLYNENFNGRRYISLNSGEYLTFSRSKLYTIAKSPAIKANEDGSYSPGQYKCDKDLQPGEYVIVSNSDLSCYVDLLASPNAQPLSSAFLFNENFSYRHYIKIEKGQYVSFTKGALYNLENEPTIIKHEQDGNIFYKAGQYKVGRDFIAGTYFLYAGTSGKSMYYELTTSAFSNPISSSFISNGFVSDILNLNLKDGQYISFSSGLLVDDKSE